MRSLIWKFWFTNWIVSLLMLLSLAAVFTYWWMFQDYREARIRPDRMVQSLSLEIDRLIKEDSDIRPYLMDNVASRYGTLYLIDQHGRDFLGRELPRSLSGTDSVGVEKVRPRMPTILANTIEMPDGERYFLVFSFEKRMSPIFYLFREFGVTVLFVVTLLATGFGSWLMTRLVATPLKRLAVESARPHSYEDMIHADENLLSRRDEIGDLARRLKSSGLEIQRLITHQQELVRDISHEIRSPLARMHVASDLLIEDPDNANSLARLQKEIYAIDNLVESLVQLSKLESPTQRTFQRLDLTNLLGNCIEDARFESSRHEVSIVFDGVKSAVVMGDDLLLTSLFDNVIRNALKYSPRESELTVVLECDDESDTWTVSVTDEGLGVPNDQLDRIFDPFVRVDSSRSRETGGHGLGLSIARKIASVHHGHLWAENKHPRGLSVIVSLPRANAIQNSISATVA